MAAGVDKGAEGIPVVKYTYRDAVAKYNDTIAQLYRVGGYLDCNASSRFRFNPTMPTPFALYAWI